MARTVQCVLLKKEADGLDFAPYPGELGKRIWESVSKEAWQQWQELRSVPLFADWMIRLVLGFLLGAFRHSIESEIEGILGNEEAAQLAALLAKLRERVREMERKAD